MVFLFIITVVNNPLRRRVLRHKLVNIEGINVKRYFGDFDVHVC